MLINLHKLEFLVVGRDRTLISQSDKTYCVDVYCLSIRDAVVKILKQKTLGLSYVYTFRCDL